MLTTTLFALFIATGTAEIQESATSEYQEACETVRCERQFRDSLRYARGGSVDAMHMVAAMYAHGYGTKQDDKKAARMLRRVSYKLGGVHEVKYALLHLVGKGVDKDPEKGVKKLTKAAKKGNSTAALYLGLLNASGTFVEQDIETAIAFLEQSSGQGNARAHLALGILHESGLQGEPDLNVALDYYEMAASSNLEAKGHLVRLTGHLEGEEKAAQIAMTFPDDEDYERISVYAPIGEESVAMRLAFIKSTRLYGGASQNKLRIPFRSCGEQLFCGVINDPRTWGQPLDRDVPLSVLTSN